ncbi:MAG: hypothetical protein E7773_14980 [Sphingomonas sp.]|uniref:hypothetical protein n=1 Tax=Sphingomonas sp. TaxID=28214 RepID=UPI0012101029|nr:hypothetical protein [Sphingomonas sp.]THD34491.1 MAG: hypothetical protein E7773_14980 [Sphingomonas sp.]
MFEQTRFEGTLSGHGHRQPIAFTAEVDRDGVLAVRLGRLPSTDAAHGLLHFPEPTEPLDRLTLEGEAADGATFFSDSFSILSESHTSLPGQELDYQGQCAVADITRGPAEPYARSSKLWHVRRLSTVHRISRETELGTVVIGGMDEAANSQRPSGFIHLLHRDGVVGDEWMERSERLLTHVSRILSFACGSYLTPVVERLFDGPRERLRVVRRVAAPPPNLAPFSWVHMEPIFRLACDTFPGRVDEIARIDPAIRWLTMPRPTWETELVNAMTAVENLLEVELPGLAKTFQTERAFRRTVRPVRQHLEDAGVDPGMVDKLPELNRRSFREKLTALLAERAIVTTDFPDGWLADMIRTRNHIIHTGALPVGVGDGGGIPGQVIWAREIATRLILDYLGFEGGYHSWLNRDRILDFPSCRPVGDA